MSDRYAIVSTVDLTSKPDFFDTKEEMMAAIYEDDRKDHNTGRMCGIMLMRKITPSPFWFEHKIDKW